ncbi:UDP-N-acetylmuramoyl-tripeptide--D-alanyl-D-alanine ligase [Roseospirillum parvum]|uniref:UDP-N-acetylmuramoyl-tripeptide--D-alanyl-D-alanine ligase n=2 Tax=Roseospirillum parvum TaxID=83401 RepID=A0A1G7UBF7_9PROT|nr:UDP-N-acetylmuramoyl-tripeptide--D-alanyl-D-alanine ligase [Roseospirillum parvum]
MVITSPDSFPGAPLWRAEDAAAATGGRAVGTWAARGVCLDSRRVTPGDLFIALPGARVDGHAFVARALAEGAAAAMVSAPPEGVDAARLLIVEDVLKGLEGLAAAARARTRARLVAITGSVGKTGTKEMLGAAFEAAGPGPIHITRGNLNNHIGCPLTLARMPIETSRAVIEMGMNHPGEIAPLSRLARPHVALITTIEAVHLAHFAGLEGIADAKAEIFAGMAPEGIAVLNRDNDQFDRLARLAALKGLEVVPFGSCRGCAARLDRIEAEGEGSRVTAWLHGHLLTYRLAQPGRHIALNSLGALAAVAALGDDPEPAAAALARLGAPPGRGRRSRIALPAGGHLDLIDDSYNASPAAVRAALAALPAVGAGRRLLALGEMLELGEAAEALHAGLAESVLAAGVAKVFTVGGAARALLDALPAERRGGHAETAEGLTEAVLTEAAAGDLLLIKGSRGRRMDRLIDALSAVAPTQPPNNQQ